MYCKKCGRKQEEGQKFCPKCGEPFLEVRQNANNEFDNNVEGTVDRAKEANWNEKKEESSSFIIEFINNPKKIGIATKTIVSLYAFWFVTKNGFSVSPIWYIIIAAMLFIAFMGIPTKKLVGLKVQYITTVCCLILLLMIGFGTANNSTNNPSSIEESGPHEICLYNDADIVGNNQGWRTFDILYSNGNCDVFHNNGWLYTKIITIPQGKKWKFIRAESEVSPPNLYHYISGNEDNLKSYKEYRTNVPTLLPIFTGGDKIRIGCMVSILPNEKQKIRFKLYFVEANDEFSK